LPVGVHTSILQYINFVLFEIRVSEQVIFELLRYMRMHCHKWFNIRKKNSWTLLLVISQKMIFMIFGVYWGLIHQLTWNIEHLVVVTWRATYDKSVSKLQKIQTKSENHETCRGVVVSHV
jgi:hypothetical protein